MLEPSLKVEPNNVEPANSRTIEPKVEPKLLSNKVLNNQKFDILLNQIKKVEEQNNLLHYELTKYFQEKEAEQKQTTNNFLNELSNLKQTISELQAENQTLTKTISEKSKKEKTKEKKRVKVKKVSLRTKPTSKNDKITMMFNHELEKQIQSFLAKNSQSFPSFSHFVRYALLSYKDGMKIDREQQFNKFPIKKSPRMSEELQNIYNALQLVRSH